MTETRNTQLPKGWAVAPIDGLLACLADGRTLHQGWSPQCEKTPSTSTDDWGVLKTTAVQPGAFLPEHNKRLPLHLSPRVHAEVRGGDLLITCAGPRSRCGVACLVRATRPKLLLSGKMYRFRVSETHFEARYLDAFLQSSAAQHSIDRMKTGGSDSGLNLTQDRFRRLEVPVAPLNEQRRIVTKLEELFSELDAGVESLKTAREQLKVYRQALLKHAFEGKLTAAWRAENADKLASVEDLLATIHREREKYNRERLAEWKRAVLYWDSSDRAGSKPSKPSKLRPVMPLTANETQETAALPEGWHWLRLGEILASLDQGWSPKCESHPATEDQWGVITTTAVQSLSFLPEENKALPAALPARPWLEIAVDDILMTRAGPRSRAGIVCRVTNTRARLMACDKVYRLRVPSDAVVPQFVEMLLNSPEISSAIDHLKTGISDSGVNLTQNGVLSLVVAVPSPAEQREVVNVIDHRLSQIHNMERDIDNAINLSEALRQSILKRAFSGQLVPQDPDDEPASVLLERIRAEKAVAGAKPSRRRRAG